MACMAHIQPEPAKLADENHLILLPNYNMQTCENFQLVCCWWSFTIQIPSWQILIKTRWEKVNMKSHQNSYHMLGWKSVRTRYSQLMCLQLSNLYTDINAMSCKRKVEKYHTAAGTSSENLTDRWPNSPK